ncbi:hypothetical protein XENOCAPTIV_011365 [Xenoophorus captivus]|uniref:Uncharacterized protein n=1 Tax=Xenoophorus captivus TaxID=1517983 RepID=A0ABV0QAC2_9TELE
MSRHHGVCTSRCSPPQWQVPYTDMMCLTKAADEDQGNIQKEQSRKMNEETNNGQHEISEYKLVTPHEKSKLQHSLVWFILCTTDTVTVSQLVSPPQKKPSCFKHKGM